MIFSYEFMKAVLDAITEHIVVIDRKGNIQFVNQSWVTFSQNNAGLINDSWKGVNYLEACDKSAAMGDELSLKAAEGIRKVINTEADSFYLEYPCHSPVEKRWFIMSVTPFQSDGKTYFVLSHKNITDRKLAEEKVFDLSRIDGLTNIFNRRYFDEFINRELRRCARLQMPITLALIDVDHFKLLNDTYGHQAGDECLRKIGDALKQFAKRPNDICARYGGEEFAIVLGDTALETSLATMDKILCLIRDITLSNIESDVLPAVTASIGLVTMHPGSQTNETELIKAADELLYQAKNSGRDQVVFKEL